MELSIPSSSRSPSAAGERSTAGFTPNPWIALWIGAQIAISIKRHAVDHDIGGALRKIGGTLRKLEHGINLAAKLPYGEYGDAFGRAVDNAYISLRHAFYVVKVMAKVTIVDP